MVGCTFGRPQHHGHRPHVGGFGGARPGGFGGIRPGGFGGAPGGFPVGGGGGLFGPQGGKINHFDFQR